MDAATARDGTAKSGVSSRPSSASESPGAGGALNSRESPHISLEIPGSITSCSGAGRVPPSLSPLAGAAGGVPLPSRARLISSNTAIAAPTTSSIMSSKPPDPAPPNPLPPETRSRRAGGGPDTTRNGDDA